jgi:hypothetical protein
MKFGKRVVAVAAMLMLGGISRAGTIGPVGDHTDTNHDLFAALAVDNFTSSSFDFEGVTDSGTFSLIGTYDATTVTGTFSASGNENTGGFVSYFGTPPGSVPGTVQIMDLTDFPASGKIYFSIDSTDSPLQQAFVLVDVRGMEADTSPIAAVPTPAAAKAGLVLLGVVGMGAIRRRRLA